MRTKQSGSVLFEVGVVSAIVAIVATMAVPAWHDYALRSEVSEGLETMASIKAAVAESFEHSGALPNDRVSANLPAAPASTQSEFVSSVDIGAGGTVTLTYGNGAGEEILGRTLQLTPYVQGDRALAWRCGYADPPMGTTHGVYRAGTISTRYLPHDCRVGQ